MLIRGAISLVLVVLAGYGIFEAAPLLRGPVIALQTPEYASLADHRFAVEGLAKHANALALNGEPLPMDEAGQFSRSMVLPSGGSILTLEARDRFGRAVTKRLAVMVP